jgi:hypothetical protein
MDSIGVEPVTSGPGKRFGRAGLPSMPTLVLVI